MTSAPLRSGETGKDIGHWLVLAACVPAGTFEAIGLHATLSGLRPSGAYLGFALFVGAGFGSAMLMTSGADRRRLLPKAALVTTLVAIAGALVLPARFAEARGALPPGIPVAQTVLFLLFQLGWAATHWLSLGRRPAADSRHQIPAALGTVLLIGGGFLLGRASDSAATTVPEAAAAAVAVYETFPNEEELAFAAHTETVGEKSGSAFAHYHPVGQPLLGLTFSTREWFGRLRIAGDLTAVFDRDEVSDGTHFLVAPEGFVVAGVEVQSDDHVNAIRVQFAPFDGTFVAPFDRYWSEWYGGHEGSDRGVRLEGGAMPIVGVRGTAGLVLSSMSLLIAK